MRWPWCVVLLANNAFPAHNIESSANTPDVNINSFTIVTYVIFMLLIYLKYSCCRSWEGVPSGTYRQLHQAIHHRKQEPSQTELRRYQDD